VASHSINPYGCGGRTKARHSKICSAQRFFHVVFPEKKKQNEKNNFPKSIKSARPSSHGSFLQEFDDRVLVVTCHQGLDKGDVQPKIPWHL